MLRPTVGRRGPLAATAAAAAAAAGAFLTRQKVSRELTTDLPRTLGARFLVAAVSVRD